MPACMALEAFDSGAAQRDFEHLTWSANGSNRGQGSDIPIP